MRSIIIAMILAAAAAIAQEGFVIAQPVHIEPLGEIDVPPGTVFADTVMLKLYLDAEGNVTRVEIWSPSGNEKIDAAAREAGKKCRFLPATENGKPVESFYQIYYRLSAYRTLEYLSAEEKAAGEAETPPPEEDDVGRE